MSFVLEVHNEGSAVALEPVGIIDLAAAKVLVEAVIALRQCACTMIEVRLGRVVAVTKSASRLLAVGEIPIGPAALAGAAA